MAKFNVVQKRRRAQIAERKRASHGDSLTRKLKQKAQPLSISGKRRRKIEKKWRREQNEAVEKGLITMEDIEMAVTDENSQDDKKMPRKINVKKGLKLKQLKRGKGKKKRNSSKQGTGVSDEAMVE
ncbi:hypothetical protein HS088_TW04G01316 [Tripterygium wilfordii]|uniref:Uncharacterized protein n=1 Tax=Tripterygium wilfordii TaxID=458696 RepID=A0A7J7DSK4_TRIWF|nr:uncharacterized protein LOC119996125 isoform X2 [Tripterygium wilfordii]KAF5749348.1 hypothetical protein HS088_TW04G01316 [Tripterygium wilfordii]